MRRRPWGAYTDDLRKVLGASDPAEEFAGPWCQCILTGCTVQRACPVYSENCRRHQQHVRDQAAKQVPTTETP